MKAMVSESRDVAEMVKTYMGKTSTQGWDSTCDLYEMNHSLMSVTFFYLLLNKYGN